jgi:hypothetical protein
MGDGTADETGDETIDDRMHYQSREFCKDVRCAVQVELDRLSDLNKAGTVYESIRSLCKSNCRYTKEDFRRWLESQGYRLETADGRDASLTGDGGHGKMTAYEFHDQLIKNGIDIVRDK